jgi:hypothetical protein
MKNSNGHIGNQTNDDLPTCSAVPQLIASLRTPRKYQIKANIKRKRCTGVYYIQQSNTRLSGSSRRFFKLHIDDDDIDDEVDVSTIAL